MPLSPIRRQILAEVDAFIAETGVSASALGQQSLGEPRTVARLRSGANLTLASVAALQNTMADIRARGAKIPRPASVAVQAERDAMDRETAAWERQWSAQQRGRE